MGPGSSCSTDGHPPLTASWDSMGKAFRKAMKKAVVWVYLKEDSTERSMEPELHLSRKMKVVEALIGMIEKFPYDDPTYDKLHEDLDKIRGKFKQLCSLLGVQPDFNITVEGSGLLF
uniref:protein LTO1 homolog isoform X7 n=1 Tax=Jaculus jaculus TaxID=51337 RepID=UPI001E1B2A4C|nr:protein LTO1 homolog isoform X7 [Jaculus jaculus]